MRGLRLVIGLSLLLACGRGASGEMDESGESGATTASAEPRLEAEWEWRGELGVVHDAIYESGRIYLLVSDAVEGAEAAPRLLSLDASGQVLAQRLVVDEPDVERARFEQLRPGPEGSLLVVGELRYADQGGRESRIHRFDADLQPLDEIAVLEPAAGEPTASAVLARPEVVVVAGSLISGDLFVSLLHESGTLQWTSSVEAEAEMYLSPEELLWLGEELVVISKQDSSFVWGALPHRFDRFSIADGSYLGSIPNWQIDGVTHEGQLVRLHDLAVEGSWFMANELHLAGAFSETDEDERPLRGTLGPTAQLQAEVGYPDARIAALGFASQGPWLRIDEPAYSGDYEIQVPHADAPRLYEEPHSFTSMRLQGLEDAMLIYGELEEDQRAYAGLFRAPEL